MLLCQANLILCKVLKYSLSTGRVNLGSPFIFSQEFTTPVNPSDFKAVLIFLFATSPVSAKNFSVWHGSILKSIFYNILSFSAFSGVSIISATLHCHIELFCSELSQFSAFITLLLTVVEN